MPSALGVEGEPFDLAMRLHLYGDVLAGGARTSPPPSPNVDGVWVTYFVRLDKGAP
jgi:hypothetical protein